MLGKHFGGLAAAVLAGAMALTVLPTTSASAASVSFFFGPYERHSMFNNGRYAVKVCHTKYKWVWHKHKRRAVRVGVECHWEYPPPRPLFQFRFGTKDYHDHDHMKGPKPKPH